MSYTTTDLATYVLRELGVLDATESPDSEDETYVTDVYYAKHEEMSASGMHLAYWPRATIPRPVLLILRDLMMLEVAGAFGQQLDPAEKEAKERIIMSRLRKHVQVNSSGRPAEAEYF